MSVRWLPVSKILERVSDPVEIEPERTYSYVGVRSFAKGLIRYPAVPAEELSKLSYFSLADDVLVISNIKAWEGAVALVDGVDDGTVVSSRFLTYRAREGVDRRYVFHYFASAVGTDALAKASPGSADRNRTLGRQRFESICIPLPDLPTQRAIAARLDRVDRASRQVEAHGGLAASAGGRVLAAALDGAPPARIGRFLTRRTESVEVVDEARYAMLGMRNRGRGAFDAGTLSGSETKYPRLSRVRAGDLIYLKLGAWEGAFGVVPEDLDGRHTSPEFITYEIDSGKVDRDFLEALVTWESFAERVGGVSKGTNLRRRRLNPETFEGLTTPLPSIEVQREAGRRLAVLRRVGRLEARRRTLADGLLPAARNEEFARLLAA